MSLLGLLEIHCLGKNLKNKNLVKEFIKYVSFNAFGMIGMACYIIVDTYFIAQGVGVDGLTALNLVLPLFAVMNALGMMIGMGGATKFTLLLEDEKKKKEVFTHSFFIAIAVGIVIMLVGLFGSKSLASVLGASKNILNMTSNYLKIIYIYGIAFVVDYALLAFVRNDGKPRLVMYAMLSGNVANIIFDYIFIFPCKMGMAGAAIATGFAPIVSILVLCLHFVSKKNNLKLKFSKLKFEYIKSIFSLGIFSFVSELSSGIVILVFNFLILKINGNIGVAAYGVVANVALVFTFLFNGIAQGTQPLISKYYALKKDKEVGNLLKYAFLVILAISIVSYITISLLAEQIIGLFNRDGIAELVNLAKIGIYIYFSSLPFLGINIISAGYFSATEKVWKSFIVSILRGLIVVTLYAVIFSLTLDMNGVWMSVPLNEMSVAVIVSIIFVIQRKKSNKSKLL